MQATRMVVKRRRGWRLGLKEDGMNAREKAYSGAYEVTLNNDSTTAARMEGVDLGVGRNGALRCLQWEYMSV